MTAPPPPEPWIFVRPGLTLHWRGYNLFEVACTASELQLEDVADGTPPECSSHRRIRMQAGDRTKRLRLLRQLGPRQINGSVWLCETLDHAEQVVQVVLKLFSPTLWDEKPSLQEYVDKGQSVEQLWQWSPGPEVAMYREVMAYARLQHLQGVHIPYSFGFYHVSSPVVGHVTEYIDAHDPHKLVHTLLDEGEPSKQYIHRMLQAIFDTYEKIHEQGVAHQDVGCRNMRIVWNADRTDNPRVVILDFDRAAFGQDGSSYSREQSTLTEFMVELGAWEVKDTVTDWLTGPGNVRFDEFGIGLIPPEGREAYRQAKAQERLQMQLYLETDEAKRYREEWTAKYNDLLVNGWDDKT